MTAQVIHGECLEVLRDMADSSVDSIVTDPPYGLSFMGKRWDYDVPSSDIWAECLRVLKPGGYLLAFAGTRTQHRMAVRIEDAGFEIRDMIAWVYGCLDEQTEVATSDGVKPYHKTKVGDTVLCYNPDNGEYSYQPILEIVEYEYSDTAYRLVGDFGEQVVSRNHRCIVEQDGAEVFVLAEQAARQQQVRVPVLESLPELRQAVSDAQQDASEAQQDLRHGVPAGCGAGNWSPTDALGVRPPRQSRRDGQPTGELDAVQYERTAQGIRAWSGHRTAMVRVVPFHYTGKVWCLRVPTGAFVAVRNGVAFPTGNSGFPKSLDVSKAIDKKANEMPVFDAIRAHIREWRDRKGYDNKALNEATGSSTTGSGMARHWTSEEGGQHAIPSKAQWRKLKALLGWPDCEFDAIYDAVKDGAERPVIGRGTSDALAFYAERPPVDGYDITAPATDAARQWQGWGTALKPSLEPVTVARKPLVGTVAENVLAHGTGAINVDACRIMQEDQERDADAYRCLSSLGSASYIRGLSLSQIRGSLLHIASVLRSYSTGDTGRLRSADDLDGTLLDLALCERLVARLFPNGAWCGGSSWSVPDSLCGCQSCRHSCDEHTRLLREVAQGGAPSLADALERICSGRFGLGHNRECRCNGRLSSSDDSQLAWSFSFLAGEYCTLYSATPQSARWPANLIHDGSEEVVALFPDSDGSGPARTLKRGQRAADGWGMADVPGELRDAGKGSAARFFYCAKASKLDRDEGLEGMPKDVVRVTNTGHAGNPSAKNGERTFHPRANHHPTVKPTDLMRYLCRLVTPPEGTVLDPFAGSGSTGKAAVLEGFDFIGIEREAQYVEIARARISAVSAQKRLFA